MSNLRVGCAKFQNTGVAVVAVACLVAEQERQLAHEAGHQYIERPIDAFGVRSSKTLGSRCANGSYRSSGDEARKGSRS